MIFFKKKTVKCGTCKHIVEIQDAQNTERNGWFCEMHKKPYDRARCEYYYKKVHGKFMVVSKIVYEVKIPEHYEEVTENGKMLKKELKKK